MTPEAVTVIDTKNGIVASGEDEPGADRAAEIKRNVERILEPHVGIGNAIVELNLDVVTETEMLTEQRFDPDSRALISQVTEETTDQSNSTGTGAVTAASNLPDADQAQGDRSEANRQETRQQANYEVTRVTREVSRQPGSTRRLTVAVLVNGVAAENAQGEMQMVPRSEGELDVLRELVASAVGYDEARGDQITVKSLPFAGLGEGGTAAAPGWIDRLELNGLARIGLIGVFALAVVFLVLRPVLKARARPALDDSLPPLEAPALTGTIMPAAEILPEPALAQSAPEHLALPRAIRWPGCAA
ncbi:flagellar M-ring protein FliF C-terminal domain-containing protein [Paracoccus aerius]